jgi:two-component system C4-dicarboxylate transport response regulator DctD
MSKQILLVDDDSAVRDAVAQTLELADLEPIAFSSFVAAKDTICADFEGVVLSDIRMPGRDGFFLLDYAKSQDPDLPVILLTGEGDVPMAVSAMGQGAFGFLEKPCAPKDLLAVIERALRTRNIVLENRRLRVLVETGDPAERMLFGQSELSQALRTRVRRVSQLETEVLIMGAPGAGISKVAEVIHLSSPDDLNEAVSSAKSGSLFIDEIALLPADSQLALLEQLEQPNSVRLLAGSTRDLVKAVDNGSFNGDLFYRIEVTPLRIPSLSERPEDIPILFRHYVAQASEQAGLTAPEITQEFTSSLMTQDWPGNTRSLMSAAMRFVLGMPEDVTQAVELGLSEQMARVEKSLLIAALGRHNGRAVEAAAGLQLPRKTFYDKLARYGIRAEDFRR